MYIYQVPNENVLPEYRKIVLKYTQFNIDF